jgi:hypothetical protein
VSLADDEVEIVVECENPRLSGQVLTIMVGVQQDQAERYAIALYSEPSGLTVGYLRIRTLERSLALGDPHLLPASALSAEHAGAIAGALRRLPPEAANAWRTIAQARPPGDSVRETIARAIGGVEGG